MSPQSTEALAPHQHSIWLQTAAAAPQSRPLTAPAQADVAIIGAGFTGLTAAWHLARRGARVVVLEAQAVGSAASGLNAGFVVPNFAKADPAAVVARLGTEPAQRLLDMVGGGADRVFDTIRAHDMACDAEQVGWLHLAHAPALREVLARRAADWQRLGHPVRMLDEAGARALSGARHCAGALLDPRGGMLHPLNYAYGLARIASAAGAVLHQRTPVDAIERDGSAWRLRCGTQQVRAAQVLLCTHAAEQGAARRLGALVVPLSVYQIATAPLASALARRIAPQRQPAADTRANLFTYRLDRDDRLISGGMSMFPIAAEARMAAMIARRLRHELDLPEVPTVAAVWRGTAAMTTDFLPHLYEFAPGLIGALGCNGRGIALTAMLGEVLADAAGGRPWAELPVPAAAPRRLPLRLLASAAPSLAIAHARWQDWRAGL